MAIFRVFGDDRYIPAGVYAEYFNDGALIKSNIFTIFRGLISDYTLIGSLIFLVVSGLISSYIYYILISKRKAIYAIVIYPFSIGIIYQTYLISTFMWNSVIAIILIMILYFNIRLIKLR